LPERQFWQHGRHAQFTVRLPRRYTELGNGVIDFTRIMPDAELAGLEEYFVEQGDNFAQDPMKSIETSARYVKERLQ
jgi:sugar phosphate isomerase/epimerase